MCVKRFHRTGEGYIAKNLSYISEYIFIKYTLGIQICQYVIDK